MKGARARLRSYIARRWRRRRRRRLAMLREGWVDGWGFVILTGLEWSGVDWEGRGGEGMGWEGVEWNGIALKKMC